MFDPGPLPVGFVCPHCGRARCEYRRGLCHSCWNDPVIRSAYPSRTSRRTGVADKNGRVPPAAGPTDAMPGSEDKLAVLAARAAAGCALFHPDDYAPG